MLVKNSVFGAIALLAAGTAPALHAQAQFIPFPSEIFWIHDVTPDGSIIVGNANDPSSGGLVGFYWDWQSSPSPTYIGGRTAEAVSDDGSVIVGTMTDPATAEIVAGRWTPTTGWISLGGLGGSCDANISRANDVSGDGEVVVGSADVGVCDYRGFIWTQATGMLPLQHLGTGNNVASAIARNGSVIGGAATHAPASWDAANPATGGTAYGFTGDVSAVSDDGGVLLGTGFLGGGSSEAFYMETGAAPVGLGSLNSGWSSRATGISNCRTRICGNDTLGLGREAWVWDAGVGIVSLRQKLTQAGVAGVPFLGYCNTMTPDGSVIVGRTESQGCWIAVLPTAEAKIYGCGLNPAGSMQVTGDPTLGSVVTLGLTNPLGTQAAGSGTLLLVGFQPQPTYPCGLPTFDGSMQPGQPGELLVSPVFFLPGLPWNGPGTTANFPIPIPTSPATVIGLQIYCQGAILDSSPGGINGLTEAVEMKIGNF